MGKAVGNNPLTKDDLVRVVEIGSVQKLYNQMMFEQKLKGYVFRGHSDTRYELKPSLLRGDLKGKYKQQVDLCLDELRRLILFFREANNHGLYVPDIPAFYQDYLSNEFGVDLIMKDENYRWLPNDMVELGVLAQHYGVETRFLDWSFDWKVALFFACAGENNTDKDGGAIWCINARWLQELKKRRLDSQEVFATTVANWNPDNCEERKRLIELIQDESIPLCFHMAPYAYNRHLYEQKGILSLWQYNIVKNESKKISEDLIEIREKMEESVRQFFEGAVVNDCKSLDELILEYFNQSASRIKAYRGAGHSNPVFLKFVFPATLKEEFLHTLRIEGYDKARISPGYHSVAEMVNEICSADMVS